jgi:hypothetical protein
MFQESLGVATQIVIIGSVIVWGGLGTLIACACIKAYRDDKKYQDIADEENTDSLV